ncbi:hypothetical protein MMH89_00080 [Candidatus Comchoanobacter bicostacola]|uniref:Uncharacterized protein n=1 Tax=Candidatus Comchoanobacter bicostacola TaxID=2919598 RepID=A0ABY5DL08_9GAMM|nr:hypothetical protein [Candidatus Comchoanobacter bicostacola]UTC24564.1 hypothetical protein MMH89_00080 [Candidatus Comchoanobacter bicostacola]
MLLENAVLMALCANVALFGGWCGGAYRGLSLDGFTQIEIDLIYYAYWLGVFTLSIHLNKRWLLRVSGVALTVLSCSLGFSLFDVFGSSSLVKVFVGLYILLMLKVFGYVFAQDPVDVSN